MIYKFFYVVCFLILIEVLLLDVIKVKIDKKRYNRFFNLTWIALTFIAAFRYGVGPDTANYMIAFKDIAPLGELSVSDFSLYRFSYFYLLLNSLSKSISDNFVVLQILQCTTFFGGLYYAIKKLRIRYVYIILYFYLFLYLHDGLSAMRESFAMGSCFMALCFYDKEKYFHFFFFVLLGFGFHSGALFFLIVPLMKVFAKYGNKGFYGLFVFCILAVVAFAPYIETIQLMLMIGDGSISRYLGNESGVLSSTNVVRNVLIMALIKKFVYDKKDTTLKKEYALLGVCFCMLDTVASSFPIVYRPALYLYVFMYYCFYHIISNIHNKRKRLLKLVVIILFFYQPFQRYISSMREYGFDPYCSIFSINKSYYDKVIKSADASDYFLY